MQTTEVLSASFPIPHLPVVGSAETTAPVRVPERSSSEDRQRALQAVYDKYVEQIYRFIYFKVGNREDAEDITSQVFVKAAHSLDVTQQDHVVVAWLYQVARTTITDYWRSFYKGPATSLDQMEEESTFHVAAPPVYLERPADEDLGPAHEKALAILDKLPANYRRVLELRFLQGCSLKETAQAMSVTEANAKVMQHRALQKAAKFGLM